jgi:outer membrane protein assembly factor BamB
VFFTATNGDAGATLYALKKADGAVAWSTALSAPTQSSPVAVYNAAGDTWIVQALSDGTVVLLDAGNGTVKDTLQLEGQVLASPAAYRNVLILSTTGADPSYIYAITLE